MLADNYNTDLADLLQLGARDRVVRVVLRHQRLLEHSEQAVQVCNQGPHARVVGREVGGGQLRCGNGCSDKGEGGATGNARKADM